MGDAYTTASIPEAFGISSRRSDDLVIVTLTGELDAAHVVLVDQAIRAAEKQDCKTIFIDLRGVSFIDSVGLNVLCAARRRCDRIRFVPSDHDQVARLIALTGTEAALGLPELPEPVSE